MTQSLEYIAGLVKAQQRIDAIKCQDGKRCGDRCIPKNYKCRKGITKKKIIDGVGKTVLTTAVGGAIGGPLLHLGVGKAASKSRKRTMKRAVEKIKTDPDFARDLFDMHELNFQNYAEAADPENWDFSPDVTDPKEKARIRVERIMLAQKLARKVGLTRNKYKIIRDELIDTFNDIKEGRGTEIKPGASFRAYKHFDGYSIEYLAGLDDGSRRIDSIKCSRGKK
jgi:hypothetical protein